jgi:hypothetical protein
MFVLKEVDQQGGIINGKNLELSSKWRLKDSIEYETEEWNEIINEKKGIYNLIGY